MEKEFYEKDWKLFRKKLPEWQASYIKKLNEHYVELLTRDLDPAQNYWECFKAMKKNQRDVGVIAEIARSQMMYNIISLLQEGAISKDDLVDFSELFHETLNLYTKGRW